MRDMKRQRHDISGKRVVITGALGGFGRAITDELKRRGARVVGIDLHEDPERDVIACDITDRSRVDDTIADAAERLGGIDVLINNAGIGNAHPSGEGVEDLDRQVLEVNLIGTWNVASAALPFLGEAQGHMVNVASLLAVVTFPMATAYAMSKRGVAVLTDSLRAEYGDRVSFTTVYPGYSATAIHTPVEDRLGLSLDGRVPEEGPDQVARWIAYAIERRPKDLATSPIGNVGLRVARHVPGLIEILGRRRAERRGEEIPRPELPRPRERART